MSYDNSLVTCDSALSLVSTQCLTDHILPEMRNSEGISVFIHETAVVG